MRPIDADALIDKYGDWYTEEGTEEGYIGTIKDIVDSMPTIEPEPHYTDNQIQKMQDLEQAQLDKVFELGRKDAKWIPCVDGNEPKANAECWISTNAKFVRRASYAPKANNQPNGFIVSVGSFEFYEYGKSAKAWMPYTKEPEPYQEEGD